MNIYQSADKEKKSEPPPFQLTPLFIELSEETSVKLKILQEEAAKIKKETRDQCNSTKRFLHAGRKAASVMKYAS